jgi:hypothetical protein
MRQLREKAHLARYLVVCEAVLQEVLEFFQRELSPL